MQATLEEAEIPSASSLPHDLFFSTLSKKHSFAIQWLAPVHLSFRSFLLFCFIVHHIRCLGFQSVDDIHMRKLFFLRMLSFQRVNGIHMIKLVAREEVSSIPRYLASYRVG